MAQCPAPQPCPACAICPAPKPEPTPAAKVPVFEAASFDALPGWREDNFAAAWNAFRASCQAVRFQAAWRVACGEGAKLTAPDTAAVRAYFESNFTPYRLAAPDGNIQGLATGYYEPLLRGSRTRRAPYLFALYAPPDDLLTIDLASTNPDLKNTRLRGRLDGRRVVPYWSRAEIEGGKAPVAGKEIVWVDDPVEAFFLEVQGSGRVQLEGGGTLRLNYADQNGHPYQSIGRWLLDRGELKPGDATMQGIKAWARANPSRLGELLNQNPSYVFFREQPVGDASAGPTGAQGLALTPERSIAVDPRFTPLGAPVYIATTFPNSDALLQRLVIAQDTGGAIRGPVRADYFWGFGAEAGAQAGRMRQPLRMWVLLPKGYPLPSN
jgi:membrane-bound lytic murein transglycosylase A